MHFPLQSISKLPHTTSFVLQDFPKALYFLQISDTTLYLIVGVVVYAYTGENAVSPALGNTGVTLQKIAYGIALPTIMIAGAINGHVCAKLVFVRIFRRNGVASKHMTSNSFTGWATWIGICVAIWAAAFLIAEVIPFFNDLLGVISALFASWFTYGISVRHGSPLTFQVLIYNHLAILGYLLVPSHTTSGSTTAKTQMSFLGIHCSDRCFYHGCWNVCEHCWYYRWL